MNSKYFESLRKSILRINRLQREILETHKLTKEDIEQYRKKLNLEKAA